MFQHTNIQRGMTVMSYDGVQLGRVIDVTTDGIVFEKGALSLRDLRVPFSEISTVRGDEIILSRDHASMRHAGMEQREGTAKGTVGVESRHLPQPHEPPMEERRAAGPGWDPLRVDEEQLEEEAPRTSGPETRPPTRY